VSDTGSPEPLVYHLSLICNGLLLVSHDHAMVCRGHTLVSHGNDLTILWPCVSIWLSCESMSWPYVT
jgi:hypothetical protein